MSPHRAVRCRARLVPGPSSVKMKTNRNLNILSPQQQTLLSSLLPVARIATSGCRKDLPVKLRTASLVIGPSGGGKSHLARSLGERLTLPIMVINVSSWVVLSARNEPWTYSVICQWLDSLQDKGGILVLDEICALDRRSDWVTYIRLEVHDLMDGIIPLAARLPSPPSDNLWGEDPPNELPDAIQREILAKRLRDRVFILACGAWQHAWRSNSRQIGFGSATAALEPPSCEQILESIEPELRQRFRNEVCWLPPLAYSDYVTVSANIENRISDKRTRNAWNRLAGPAIEEAVAGGLGMRVFEELMLAALLDAHDRDEPGRDALYQPEI